jgi:hypothetical protein
VRPGSSEAVGVGARRHREVFRSVY